MVANARFLPRAWKPLLLRRGDYAASSVQDTLVTVEILICQWDGLVGPPCEASNFFNYIVTMPAGCYVGKTREFRVRGENDAFPPKGGVVRFFEHSDATPHPGHCDGMRLRYRLMRYVANLSFGFLIANKNDAVTVSAYEIVEIREKAPFGNGPDRTTQKKGPRRDRCRSRPPPGARTTHDFGERYESTRASKLMSAELDVRRNPQRFAVADVAVPLPDPTAAERSRSDLLWSLGFPDAYTNARIRDTLNNRPHGPLDVY